FQREHISREGRGGPQRSAEEAVIPLRPPRTSAPFARNSSLCFPLRSLRLCARICVVTRTHFSQRPRRTAEVRRGSSDSSATSAHLCALCEKFFSVFQPTRQRGQRTPRSTSSSALRQTGHFLPVVIHKSAPMSAPKATSMTPPSALP